MKSIFSIRLKEERLNKNLTQQKLVDLINEDEGNIKVSRNSITRYENGTRTPDYSTLCSIAYVLNVDIDYLLGKSDKKHIEFAREELNDFLTLTNEIIKNDNAETNDALWSLISDFRNIISIAYENDLMYVMNEIVSSISTITNFAINTKDVSRINNLNDVLHDIVQSPIDDIVRQFYKKHEPNNIQDIKNLLINNKEGD